MIDISGLTMGKSSVWGGDKYLKQLTVALTVIYDETNPKSFVEKEEFLIRLKRLCEEYQ